MSASAKPPQSRVAKHTPEQIAKGLLTAELLGDRWAAQTFNVHRNTILNWRSTYSDNPDVQALIAKLRERVDEEWIRRVTEARFKLLGRVVELASVSRNLRHVTDGFRRVNEAALASLILKDGGGAEHLGTGVGGDSQEAAGEVKGPRGEEHDPDEEDSD